MNLVEWIVHAEPMTELAAAWVLTFAIHSTLLLGAGYFLTRWDRISDALGENRVWKGLLVAGLFTATIHVGAGWGTDMLYVGDAERSDPPGWHGSQVVAVQAEVRTVPGGRVQFVRAASLERAEAEAESSEGGVLPAGVRDRIPVFILLVWVFGALGAGGWRVVQYATFRWRLSDRERVRNAGVDRMVADLTEGVRWSGSMRCSRSDAIASPVLLNDREIVLPNRFFDELSPNQQRAVLAHEVGHLARRDRWWTTLAVVLESLFFFQPLVRVARRRIQDRAEELADRWAARRTGSPHDVAEVLLTVAGWVQGGIRSDLAPSVVRDGSGLERRIRGLLRFDASQPPTSPWSPFLAIAGLSLIVACGAPGVGSTPERADSDPTPVVSANVRTVQFVYESSISARLTSRSGRTVRIERTGWRRAEIEHVVQALEVRRRHLEQIRDRIDVRRLDIRFPVRPDRPRYQL